MSKLAKKTHQKILGKIFWVRVNEPNSKPSISENYYVKPISLKLFHSSIIGLSVFFVSKKRIIYSIDFIDGRVFF